MPTSLITLLLSCLLCSTQVLAVVSDNIRIHSEILSYDLQYRIYRPANLSPEAQLPVVYVTDGEWYLHELDMPKSLDKLINKGAIRPLQVVFVDSRNPDDLPQNRRNQQFM